MTSNQKRRHSWISLFVLFLVLIGIWAAAFVRSRQTYTPCIGGDGDGTGRFLQKDCLPFVDPVRYGFHAPVWPSIIIVAIIFVIVFVQLTRDKEKEPEGSL